MTDEDGFKWLTVARLTELLAELPQDNRVMTNAVGNLLVLSADGTHSISFVDFVCDGEVLSLNKEFTGYL